MGRVTLVVEMGADERRSEEQIEEDLIKIPGVVDVLVETGEVTIFGIADAAATLKARLEATLGKPVTILADQPVRPVGAGYQPYGYGGMLQQPPPQPPVPWYPPLGPYIGYNLPPYVTPFDDDGEDDEYDHGCSCSIQ